MKRILLLLFLFPFVPLALPGQTRRPLWTASPPRQPAPSGAISATDGPARAVILPPGSQTFPDEPYSFEKGGKETPREYLGNPYFLGFAGGLHRPPSGERVDPALADRIRRGPRNGEDQAFTYAYVMFQGRITEAKKRSVRALGVKLLFYHPNNSYAARIPVHLVGELAAMPCVRWVGFAQPTQKIHPALDSVMSETPAGRDIPIYIDLFESDLGPESEKVMGPLPELATIGREQRKGDPAYAGWSWKTHGKIQARLEKLGVKIKDYREEIQSYEAEADAWTILKLVDLDFVAFLEWRPKAVLMHDRVIPQVGADYFREIYKATTVTVGVIDSGFHLANGGYNGHVDLSKQAVGWNYWTGGCGSVYCDEKSTGYHGTHVLGTICGEGKAQIKYRGISPYLGSGPATHRLFLVKGLTSKGFFHMRQDYKDPWNHVTPRPVVVTNSWGHAGCLNNCTQPAFWIGSEADARICDAEVFNYNQLYIFAAGNHGGIGGKNYVAGTLGIEAVAKNVLAVGMCRDGNRTTPPAGGPGSIVSWSSHGPCGDGRWKPNVSAPGCVTMSTAGGTRTGYKTMCGTSMSAPVVAGIMASTAERYPSVGKSAPLMRAWAMATAVTRDDATAQGSWGHLPSSHLNSHGMGRISALKALRGGGYFPWIRVWLRPTIGTGGGYYDLTVNPGTTRLVLVLTWDDPPAAPGAKPAAVHDLDLYLDKYPFTAGTNTGEYKSTSSLDTVEHLVLNNPAPGKYRVKIHAYKLTGTVRVGLMTLLLSGDTTPSGALTLTPDKRYIKPGGTVDLTVSAKPESYIATNVWVGEGAHTGFSRTGSSLELKDGVVVAGPHDAGDGGVLLGDVLRGQARKVVYRYKETSGRDAVRYLYFSGLSDNWGTRHSRATVVVDGTPPFSVRNLRSTTHATGTWSNQGTIHFTWTAAWDNLSGIDGYSILTSFGSAAIPNAVKDIGALTAHDAVFSSSTKPYYFSIRSLDRSGNWGRSFSWTGPYYIDTLQPGTVTNLKSTTHSPGAWSRNPRITFTWTAAPDAHSGLDGYGVLFSDDKPTRPGAIKKIGALTNLSATLPSSAHAWYFNIRSTDKAKNWDDHWVSSGPYWIDALPPTGVTLKIDHGAPETSSPDVGLSITAADPHSGVAYMRFSNDGGSWSPWFPFAPTRSWKLTDYGGSPSLGSRTVVMEVRDRAGNTTRAKDTIYYFKKVVYFGTACAGSKGIPSFVVGGVPGVGRSVGFLVKNTSATAGALFFGVSRTSWMGLPLPIDLKFVGAPSCFLNISLDAPVYIGALTPIRITVPRDPVLAGVPTHFQWLLFGDSSGKAVVTTKGATMVLGGL